MPELDLTVREPILEMYELGSTIEVDVEGGRTLRIVAKRDMKRPGTWCADYEIAVPTEAEGFTRRMWVSAPDMPWAEADSAEACLRRALGFVGQMKLGPPRAEGRANGGNAEAT